MKPPQKWRQMVYFPRLGPVHRLPRPGGTQSRTVCVPRAHCRTQHASGRAVVIKIYSVGRNWRPRATKTLEQEHSESRRRTALNHISWPRGRIRAFGAANGTVPSTMDTMTSPTAVSTSMPRDTINPLRHSAPSRALPESSRRHARHDGFRAHGDVIGILTGPTYVRATVSALACTRTHAVRRGARARSSGVRAPSSRRLPRVEERRRGRR